MDPKKKPKTIQPTTALTASRGFHDALLPLLDATPIRPNEQTLFASEIEAPLGTMIAIADKHYLYLLEFFDGRGLEKEVERLKRQLNIKILPGKTRITDQIEKDLSAYFSGKSKTFQTPCFLLGSIFEKSVWQTLQSIPAGQTRSYLDIAKAIGNPKACRAVASANSKNQLTIIIPCHRVINENGGLGGYSGGLTRKQWLIRHEKSDSRE